jgi:mono/diheme cytochrome c family protein
MPEPPKPTPTPTPTPTPPQALHASPSSLPFLLRHPISPSTPFALPLATLFFALLPTTATSAPETAAARSFADRYCIECHGADEPEEGLDLSTASWLDDPALLEEIADRLRRRSMPPSKHDPLPSPDEAAAVLAWIEASLDQFLGTDPDPGRVAIRRLTRTDYKNTIRDLLGLDVDVSSFPSDDVAHGFDNLADMISLPPLLMERYGDAAESLSRRYLDRELGDKLATLSHEQAMPFLTDQLLPLAQRAFRRPLADDESQAIIASFHHGETQGWDPASSLDATLQRILLSPHFLFRIEADGPIGQDIALSGFELASRLSYLFWSSMPDERLFELAALGDLHDPDTLRAQVGRMLADPKLDSGLIRNFGAQWLQTQRLPTIGPDPGRFPDFDPALRDAMAEETHLLLAAIIRENRPILDLIDADFTFANARLAAHYDLPDRPADDAFSRVDLSHSPRRGILTHASILAINSHPTRTSPVRRGKWVLEAILGDPPPPPVPDAGDLPETIVEGTLRQQLELHREDPRCASCHVKMDALGLALEHFDAVGAWRSEEAGHPIDAAGELDGQRFPDAAALAQILRRDYADAFRTNFATQLFLYGVGRTVGRPDRAVIAHVVKQASSAGDTAAAYLAALVATDPFRMRRNPARIGIENLPDSLDFKLSGNPDQLMRLSIQAAPSSADAPAEAPFEIHTLKPVLRAVASARSELALPAAAPDASGVYRYPVTAAPGQEILLFFMPGLLAPGEYSDDFLMPVATIPVTEEPATLHLAPHDATWAADLHTSSNARPGTLYSFDFQARLTGAGSTEDTVDVWLTNAGATNRAAFEDSGPFPIRASREMQTFTRVGRRVTEMVGSWSGEVSAAISARADLVVAEISPIRLIRPLLDLDAPPTISLPHGGESRPITIRNGQQRTLTDHTGRTWPTLLYGTTNIHQAEDKQDYHKTIDNIGAILIGEHAAHFALAGPTLAGAGIALLAPDGSPGLAGGPEPDSVTFTVRHTGANNTPARPDATLRIITQAGGTGALSSGEQGEPPANLYYTDVPITLD